MATLLKKNIKYLSYIIVGVIAAALALFSFQGNAQKSELSVDDQNVSSFFGAIAEADHSGRNNNNGNGWWEWGDSGDGDGDDCDSDGGDCM